MRGGNEEPRAGGQAVGGRLLEGDDLSLRAGLRCQETEEPASEKLVLLWERPWGWEESRIQKISGKGDGKRDVYEERE